MSDLESIKEELRKLSSHDYIEIVTRGNAAIKSSLSFFPDRKIILIPEEGGWISYKNIPPQLGLKIVEVKCNDAKIDLHDLKSKLQGNGTESKPVAFLYQNPGGYFSEQPMQEIYELCQENGCLVIMDVSGSLGTKLCDGRFADILVGSFGKWKLVEAHVGGFISCKGLKLFNKLKHLPLLEEDKLKIIVERLTELPKRIKFFLEERNRINEDLKELDIVHREDLGFVVVVKFTDQVGKGKIVEYCKKKGYEFTECPRYIRLNRPAISIEVKRLIWPQ
jgi:hypothetical protein